MTCSSHPPRRAVTLAASVLLVLVSAPATGGTVGTGDPAPAPAPAGRGGWPLRPQPTVERGFAPPLSPWGAGHRGVDLRGSPGQPVRAAAAGEVTFAGRLAGRGVVVVSHGDTRSTYEPVAADVAVGRRVRQGAVLGRLELLGSHCLPAACLHWGLLRGEVYLDPLTLVGAGPVRLLPWRTGPLASGPAAGLLGAPGGAFGAGAAFGGGVSGRRGAPGPAPGLMDTVGAAAPADDPGQAVPVGGAPLFRR